MIIGLITEGLGSVFEGYMGLFDLLLFLNLSIGVIFMATAFLKKKN